MTNKLYDIFITHAWRFHDEWTRMGDMLDACETLKWRNFSVPWHDPAMDTNTEIGMRFIRNCLESQIVPVAGVILLNGVYETKSSRKWVDLEIEMARKHSKPVFAVPTFKQTDVLPEVREMSDMVVQWDCQAMIGAIDAITG
ncbi:MAG: TIR domain-containing protein [Candidatus Thiosymbion ectosymbiont of Robbea hypermnestra]|nr:TIR domain-containing protein [Candidatus Thiosymbion ectosymbiont of Robbea hypermnestra]